MNKSGKTKLLQSCTGEIMEVYLYKTKCVGEYYSYYLEEDVFDNIIPGELYTIGKVFVNGQETPQDQGVPLGLALYSSYDIDRIKKISFYNGEDEISYQRKFFVFGHLSRHKYLTDAGLTVDDDYNYDGFLYEKRFTNHRGLMHNESGPARILYKTDGNIYYFYYLNNKPLSKQAWENQIQTKLYW